MTNFNQQRVMVCVAHPDDELLGLGGSINKLVNDYGCIIKVVILGEGLTSREDNRNVEKFKSDLIQHKSNIKLAQKELGYQELSVYDFPDNRFDTVPLLDLIKVIEKEKDQFKPDLIFTHHGGDVNIDHKLTFDAVITACRPLESESVKSIITFETLSGTEWIPSSDPKKFNPNFYFSLSKQNLESKIKAMECYEFEKRDYPHPRSSKAILNRAEMWGISIGNSFAEAFQVIRSIN